MASWASTDGRGRRTTLSPATERWLSGQDRKPITDRPSEEQRRHVTTIAASLPSRARRRAGAHQALVLIDLGGDGTRPPPGPRVRAITERARSSGVRVVHLLGGPGSDSEDIPPSNSNGTVRWAPGEALDEADLDALTGPGIRTAVLAGDPTSERLVEVARRLHDRQLTVIILEDVSGDGGSERHEAAMTGPLGDVAVMTDSTSWLDGLPAPRRRRRRRLVLVGAVVVIVALLAAGFLVARSRARDYYLLSPGTAPLLTPNADCQARTTGSIDLSLSNGSPCARLVVPSGRDHGIGGALYMVDVLEGPATATDYILSRFHLLKTFHDGSQLLPASSVLGNTPANQLPCQDAQQMVQATEDAPVAALRHLGYDVNEQDHGAQIDLVMPGLPAAAAGLACNDVITSVDGRPVHTVGDVEARLGTATPGTAVAIGVQSAGRGGQPTTRTVHTRLVSQPPEPGVPPNPNKGFLGIELQTRATYVLPFHVTINVGDIGGPSAGLALSLGLVDVLSNGRLTGGQRVAATGTIDSLGHVGAIGGLAQKAVAVRRAGARIFFVPASNPPADIKAARDEAGGKLRIEPVSTLAQAVGILGSLGGVVPSPSGH